MGAVMVYSFCTHLSRCEIRPCTPERKFRCRVLVVLGYPSDESLAGRDVSVHRIWREVNLARPGDGALIHEDPLEEFHIGQGRKNTG